MLARHNCAPTYLSRGPLQNAGKTRMVASTSRDSCGIGTFRSARSGSVRGRAHLRLEAAAGYRIAASVWRVPDGPHFSPGSRAASGSIAITGVAGRLFRREAAAGTPTGRRGGGAGQAGPAGSGSPPVAPHTYHRVPACERAIGK